MLKRHRGRLYGALKKIDRRAVEVVAKELAGTLRVEHKLLAFVKRYPPSPPVTRPAGARVDFSNLGPVLRIIYEHRSRDLHDGVAFPQPLCETPMSGDDGTYERFPLVAVRGAGGIWGAEVLPIYLHMFAHLVRESVLAWAVDRARTEEDR